jgi:hypothetical protein
MLLSSSHIELARAVPIEEEIARRGIVLKGKGADRAGPCPVCGGTDRFAINVRKGLFLCRGCGVGGDVITLVRHLDDCSFAEAIELLAGEAPRRTTVVPPAAKRQTTYEQDQHRKAAWLWSSKRQPIAGTLAECYLRSRGISCPLPPTLGFLPAADNHPPALIAAFGIASEPEPGMLAAPASVGAVHITRLLPDGNDRERGDKAKIMVGRSLGLPIVIAPPNDLMGLAITEGIEDALTVYQATALGAWAAGAAGRMSALATVVPNYIEAITIYVHFADEAGRDGAQALADALDRRNHDQGDPVNVEILIEGLS